MRLLARCSHDDHDLGEVYECADPERAARLLAAGVALPADEYTFTLKRPQDRTGDFEYLFTRVAPPNVAELAPAPVVLDPAAPIAPVAPDVEVR